MVGDRKIEDLDIGFTAVATEINLKREIWLNRGQLFEAIRASIAMPLIFAPVERGGLVLVDGGLVNPVPIAPTLNADTTMTIAIGLDGAREELKSDDKSKGDRNGPGSSDIRQKIAEFIGNFLPRKAHDKPDSLSALELALQSIDTMQRTIAHMKLAVYEPDIEIQMPANLCTFLEFHRARELIDFGYRRTEESLRHAGLVNS